MRIATSVLFIFGGIGGLIAACSSTPSTPPAGNDAGLTDTKPTSDVQQADTYSPSCAEAKACDPSSQPTNGECLVSVDATLFDLGAKPITTESIYICGTNLCTSPLAADAMGKVHGDVCLWFVKPAFKYLGGPNFASFASAIPMNSPSVSLSSVVLTPLPTAGVDFPANGGDVSSNGATLTAPAAAGVKFDLSESSDPNWHKWRAVQVDLKNAPPFFDNTTLKLEVLWGLAPVNALITPSATLKVPNTQKWAANAAVEFFLNGCNNGASMPPAPYGGWGPIGTGHVSQDGTTVSTDPGMGNGIPMIGMVGIRLKM
jgi:hypothetical protein